MSEYLESLGYLGAFLGSVLEGELALITTLQTAHLGYTNFYGILLAAFLGTQSVDWFLFLTGRHQGQGYLEKKPKLQSKLQYLERVMDRHDQWLLLSYRFLYGFRLALPLLFGISDVPLPKFAIYSLISTLIWITVIGNLGYYLLSGW